MKPLALLFIGALTMALPQSVSAASLDEAEAAYTRHDYAQALQVILPLAEAGDPKAQYVAGYMYGHGQGAPANLGKSLAWYRLAADQGDAESEFSIGLAYEDGRGVPRDYAEAMNWYLKAAEQGLPRAQNNLGNLYNDGLGVQRNYPLAHMWYALSQAGGDERAERNVVLIEQVMTAKDIVEAHKLADDWLAAHPRQLASP